MDIDGTGAGNHIAAQPDPGLAAAAASAVLHTAIAAREASVTNSNRQSMDNNINTDNPQVNVSQPSTAPNSVFQQCSNAKRISRTCDVLTCTPSASGPVYTSVPTSIPRIGSMFNKDNDDLQKTFHGARIMKSGVQTNEVITCSFDPATLNCLACPTSHRILNKSVPVTICFADQNFVPTLSSGPDQNCIAVVRYEDASLQDLTAIALEILEKHTIHPGSVLLFGTASHLFRVGASCYAADWVGLITKLEQKFRNVNICPLIPVIREQCQGSLAFEIEILATWLNRMYTNNIKGMIDTWNAVVHFVQNAASGHTTFDSANFVKIPLPANLSTMHLTPAYFSIRSSHPALLNGMDCTVTTELLRILLTALQRDFSMAIGPEVILPRAHTATGVCNQPKHLVCIGSSIMQQLVPYLQAAGYTITDLSQPGWLATDENIQILIKKMSELQLDPGTSFAVILDLFSNCSHRYLQFDGTQSLPHKEGGRYHMAGPVVPCNEDTFKKIIKLLSPVLLASQSAKKIIIPPLPRYLFNTCCASRTHCSNFLEDGYAESSLNGTTKLRGIIKRECAAMGMRNQWVLDGIGAMLGTPPGQSCGSNREILPDLKQLFAKDGVHLTQSGNKKLASGIASAIEHLDTNNNTVVSAANAVTGGELRRQRDYFWRGFTSPVGDTIGRVTFAGQNHGQHHGRRDRGQDHHYRPYGRPFRRH
jgi:hypothetical protein